MTFFFFFFWSSTGFEEVFLVFNCFLERCPPSFQTLDPPLVRVHGVTTTKRHDIKIWPRKHLQYRHFCAFVFYMLHINTSSQSIYLFKYIDYKIMFDNQTFENVRLCLVFAYPIIYVGEKLCVTVHSILQALKVSIQSCATHTVIVQ